MKRGCGVAGRRTTVRQCKANSVFAFLIAALIAVLNLCIICPDAFRPVVKLVIFASARIGKTEEVVLLAASVGAKPARFKDGLRQYDVRVKDSGALDFSI